MESALRRCRKARNMKLKDVRQCLLELGYDISIPTLSLVERGEVWPLKDTVDGLLELYKGDLTLTQILYPFPEKKDKNHAA
jgi:transcriptional regulator with XRE-family HTH domain